MFFFFEERNKIKIKSNGMEIKNNNSFLIFLRFLVLPLYPFFLAVCLHLRLPRGWHAWPRRRLLRLWGWRSRCRPCVPGSRLWSGPPPAPWPLLRPRRRHLATPRRRRGTNLRFPLHQMSRSRRIFILLCWQCWLMDDRVIDIFLHKSYFTTHF